MTQIILPEGYLQEVYEEMRAEGAVCIADEVRLSTPASRVTLHASLGPPVMTSPFWNVATLHDTIMEGGHSLCQL